MSKIEKSRFSETIIANSGKTIGFKGLEIKIVNSGISQNGIPYVRLNPPNAELCKKMCDELEKHGNFTVRLGRPNRLILGKATYPIWE
jgi:hypothetical protein